MIWLGGTRRATLAVAVLIPSVLAAQREDKPWPWTLTLEYYEGEGSDRHIALTGAGGEMELHLVSTLTLRPGVSLLISRGHAPLEGELASAAQFNATAVGVTAQVGVQWSPITSGVVRPVIKGTGGFVGFDTGWPPVGSRWNFACRWRRRGHPAWAAVGADYRVATRARVERQTRRSGESHVRRTWDGPRRRARTVAVTRGAPAAAA